MLDDLVRLLAEQDVDHVTRAEPLPPLTLEAEHGGQEFLGGHRPVPRLRRHEAGVAVAAGGTVLAEVAKELAAAALDCLAQGQHGVEVGAHAPAMSVAALGGIDQLPLLHDIGKAIGEPGGGGQAVTAGPAGLLVVPLNRLGQVQVGHVAHVRLVDAHAERDGGDHGDTVLAQETRLVRGPGPRVEAGVVRQRLDPVRRQELSRLLDGSPGQAVHDARVSGVLGAQQLQQLPLGLVLGRDAVADVRPVEAGHEAARPIQVQPLRDLGPGRLGGGRGQRDAGHMGPALVQGGEGEIVGPEVVPPLGDTVRFVDGEQGHGAPVEQAQGRFHPQAFRREVEQVQLAREESRLDLAALARILR